MRGCLLNSKLSEPTSEKISMCVFFQSPRSKNHTTTQLKLLGVSLFPIVPQMNTVVQCLLAVFFSLTVFSVPGELLICPIENKLVHHSD